MKTEQQKACGWTEHIITHVKFFITVGNFLSALIVIFEWQCRCKTHRYNEKPSHEVACGVLFFLLWTVIDLFSLEFCRKSIKELNFDLSESKD